MVRPSLKRFPRIWRSLVGALRDMLFTPDHYRLARDSFALNCPNCHCHYEVRIRKHRKSLAHYSQPVPFANENENDECVIVRFLVLTLNGIMEWCQTDDSLPIFFHPGHEEAA